MKAFRWTLIGLFACFGAWFVCASNNPLTRTLQPPVYGWVPMTSAADPMEAGGTWSYGPLPERFRFKLDAAYPVSYVVVPDYVVEATKKSREFFTDTSGMPCSQLNVYRREEDCSLADQPKFDGHALQYYLMVHDNRDVSAKHIAAAGALGFLHAGGALDELHANNRVSYSVERWACVQHCDHT
jgi:hypothetical protein